MTTFWCCESANHCEDISSFLTPSSHRVNSYWVFFGIWWCEPIANQHGIKRPKSLSSRLPTATPWPTDAKGLLIFDYRLEAGRLPHLGNSRDSRLRHTQIWTALKQYKQLPHTFIYLFAFFLLADVRLSNSICRSWFDLFIRFQGFNTTGTLVFICQNEYFQFSFLQITYLGISQAVTSIIR